MQNVYYKNKNWIYACLPSFASIQDGRHLTLLGTIFAYVVSSF